MSRLSFVLSVPVVMIGAAILFLSDGSLTAPVPGGSGPEMHSKRAFYEWERLHDPATGRIPAGIREGEVAFATTHPRQEQAAAAKGAGAAAADFGWQHRGPWNIGGRTRAMALDVTGEDTILAGGVSGGMWRSVDAGESWRMVTRPDQLPSVTTIAQDTRAGREATWYFGSGELYGNSAGDPGAFWFGNGIYKSSDNGESWEVIASTADMSPASFSPISNIWRLAIDTTREDIDRIYAAIYDRIMRSDDGGETWNLAAGGSPGGASYFSDVALASDGSVYATLSSDGSRKGIYRSSDGDSFTKILPPDMPTLYRRIVIGTAASEPQTVYFLAETPGNGFLGQNFRGDSSWHSLWKYTYVSGDGTGDGGIWENRSANLPSFDWGGGSGDLFSQSSYDLHVRVKPDNPEVVFVGGTNLYRSKNGFASDEQTSWVGGFKAWDRDSSVIESYSYPEHHADQHDVIFSPTNPSIMYSASDGGVHRTFDCLADSIFWTSLNTGYLTSQFYTVAIDHGTPDDPSIMGGLQDNGTWITRSAELQAPWVRTGSSDGAFCAIADGGASLYVSKQLGRIFRVDVDDRGAIRGSARVDPVGAGPYRFINPFILDPSDSRRMYLPIGDEIWRNDRIDTIPTGSNLPTSIGWQKIEGSKPVPVAGEDVEITAIAASKRNPVGRVYFGTDTGRIYRMDDAAGETPVAVDVTVQGMPVGALQVYDEVTTSLSVRVHEPHQQLDRRLGVTNGSPVENAASTAIAKAMTDMGRIGRRAGQGFYDYDAEGNRTLWPGLLQFKLRDLEISDSEAQDRILYIQAIETLRCLNEGVLRSEAEATLGSLLGIGFPPYTGGAIQFIRGIGIDTFAARAKVLGNRFGARFVLDDSAFDILRGGVSKAA